MKKLLAAALFIAMLLTITACKKKEVVETIRLTPAPTETPAETELSFDEFYKLLMQKVENFKKQDLLDRKISATLDIDLNGKAEEESLSVKSSLGFVAEFNKDVEHAVLNMDYDINMKSPETDISLSSSDDRYELYNDLTENISYTYAQTKLTNLLYGLMGMEADEEIPKWVKEEITESISEEIEDETIEIKDYTDTAVYKWLSENVRVIKHSDGSITATLNSNIMGLYNATKKDNSDELERAKNLTGSTLEFDDIEKALENSRIKFTIEIPKKEIFSKFSLEITEANNSSIGLNRFSLTAEMEECGTIIIPEEVRTAEFIDKSEFEPLVIEYDEYELIRSWFPDESGSFETYKGDVVSVSNDNSPFTFQTDEDSYTIIRSFDEWRFDDSYRISLPTLMFGQPGFYGTEGEPTLNIDYSDSAISVETKDMRNSFISYFTATTYELNKLGDIKSGFIHTENGDYPVYYVRLITTLGEHIVALEDVGLETYMEIDITPFDREWETEPDVELVLANFLITPVK